MKVSTIAIAAAALGASMFAGNATALTRSCKALSFVRYTVRVNGRTTKTHIQGPQNILGRGSSPGIFASPVKARRRACQQAARKASAAWSYRHAKSLICRKHGARATAQIREIGGWGQSQLEIQTVKQRGVSTRWFRCSPPRRHHARHPRPPRGHSNHGNHGRGSGKGKGNKSGGKGSKKGKRRKWKRRSRR